MIAVCERNQAEEVTEYAYLLKDGNTVISNCDRLASTLGEEYDAGEIQIMRRLEKFQVDRSEKPLPKVKEAGIPSCLMLWRMADSYHADADWFNFYLCTGKTEYIFSVRPKDTDIYCGASRNFAFDMGLFSGGQYFRIRNYKENRDKYCTFWRNFSYEVKHIEIPTIQYEPGKCTRTDQGLSWAIKRYTDDEIVLQGCGDDEYIYRRLERRDERFLLCKEKSEG